jgi:hypothetical protein
MSKVMAMKKPVKKAASKKVVSKKGDEPVRVGSKSTSKKGRVLTAAESKAAATGRESYSDKGREFKDGFYRGKKMKGTNSDYWLAKAIVRRGFGDTKPMTNIRKRTELSVQRSNNKNNVATGHSGFGQTAPRKKTATRNNKK